MGKEEFAYETEKENQHLAKKFKKYLARKHCLLARGATCYFDIDSSTSQKLNLGDPVIFQVLNLKKNISFKTGTSLITVHRSGYYYIVVDIALDEPTQFTIFINNIPIPSLTTGVDSGAGQVSISQIIFLKNGDNLKIVNWKSAINPVYTTTNGGGNQVGINASFAGFMLLPCENEKD
jgi:hypothetical protein